MPVPPPSPPVPPLQKNRGHDPNNDHNGRKKQISPTTDRDAPPCGIASHSSHLLSSHQGAKAFSSSKADGPLLFNSFSDSGINNRGSTIIADTRLWTAIVGKRAAGFPLLKKLKVFFRRGRAFLGNRLDFLEETVCRVATGMEEDD
ncbi:hypothetical protein JTE90_025491 [Oedothorax gibbosus]|uniref:Uncharacterized protein n=1 Tax=Oedothorax gibbosus TaxID=931172 RepID=A0AAV6UY36_9ARAC|nr:hypothetical protein JTE90_025491 [Oedothorax gibbosus]